MKIKTVPLRLDELEHKELKIMCIEKGLSMQEFMVQAIREKKKKWAV
jgi:predicted HicB family RNase H-like nuclease